LSLLAEASVAAFRTPESCADALRAYLDWRAPRPLSSLTVPTEVASELEAASGLTLDARCAARIFEQLGVPVASELLLPADSDVIDSMALTDLTYPVVAKILSPDVPHKTEVGGVVVGCDGPAALKAACREILANVALSAPVAVLVGIQVQPLLRGIGEALLGFARDPCVGPVVTLGVGGVLTEIYRDVSVRMAPIDEDEAQEMIREVRGLAPLRGYRGMERGDVRALAKAIAAFSRLGILDVSEAEINPLLIGREGEGVVAVDALLVKGQIHAR
jgi:acetate---CoA ligase (ADP-forming)